MDRKAIYVLKMTNDDDFDSYRGHMIVYDVTYEDEHGFKFISKGHEPGV